MNAQRDMSFTGLFELIENISSTQMLILNKLDHLEKEEGEDKISYSVKEVARRTGLSKEYLYIQINSGVLKSVQEKFKGKITINKEDLDKFIAERERKGRF